MKPRKDMPGIEEVLRTNPDGFQSCRVIYGDLSVREVMPDNLPAAK